MIAKAIVLVVSIPGAAAVSGSIRGNGNSVDNVRKLFGPIVDKKGEGCPASVSLDDNNSCPKIWSPVLCGPNFDCEYYSQCHATLSGGFDPQQCISECLVHAYPLCDDTKAPVTCTQGIYAPKIQPPCEFPNQCLANAAGFNASHC